MKALRITRFGDPDVLRVEDVATPEPQTGQALVRVRAAGVNRADLLQRTGRYPPPADAPADIPGLEFAGEVVKIVGPTTRVRVGERVFGLCSGGAQAEFIAIATDLLVPTPATLDDITAGGIAEAYITAHDALITQAHVRARERVLVHAVGSAVGIAALQIVKDLGCEAFGTSRTAWKLDKARALGLDHGLAGTVDFAEAIRGLTTERGVDVIIDLVGADYFERNVAALSSRGRMVVLATQGGTEAVLSLRTLMHKRLRLMGSVLRSRTLEEKVAATTLFARDVLPKFASRALRVVIDKTFALSAAPDAHRYIESNANFGKVILTL